MVYKVVPHAGSTKRVDSWQIDTLALMNILKITYDTLDESKMIEVTNKKQIKESEKEKKILKLNKKE
jgi:alpha-N-acetylglucosamine transferase